MPPRFRLRTVFLVLAGIAVYLGAYRAMLDPMIVADVAHLGMVVEGSREPHYRSLNGVCRFAFAPLEWIDYKIRPEYWDHYADDVPVAGS